MRDRLARRIVTQRGAVARPELEPLIAVHKQAQPKADVRLLQRGYDVAERQHRGQMRKSGDPYITSQADQDRLSANPRWSPALASPWVRTAT